MQFRPVLHAAALAAAMLFAAGASAQQVPMQSPRNPAATANDSGGTATPEIKAKAEHLKESVRKGTHELHQKIDSEMDKSKKARASGEELTWKSEHEKKSGAHSRSTRNSRANSSGNAMGSASGNNMGSASFRSAMSKCTDNENMQARADCAREAVEAHGGSAS